MRYARPCFETISTGTRSSFTCSISGNSLLRVAVAVGGGQDGGEEAGEALLEVGAE